MSKKTGKRVNIYIPADLVDLWDTLPKYDRSAIVGEALRSYFKEKTEKPARSKKGKP